MSLQQIHDYFQDKGYNVHPINGNDFEVRSADGNGAHVEIAYPDRHGNMYLAAYYGDKQRRPMYRDVFENRIEIMNHCREDVNWHNVCIRLNQDPNAWQEEWRDHPDNLLANNQGWCKFTFTNPYADGNLSEAFMEAIRQLADIIIANFP